jgi:hypothetical protein
MFKKKHKLAVSSKEIAKMYISKPIVAKYLPAHKVKVYQSIQVPKKGGATGLIDMMILAESKMINN